MASRATPTAPAANTTDDGTVAIDWMPLPCRFTTGLTSAGASLSTTNVMVAALSPMLVGLNVTGRIAVSPGSMGKPATAGVSAPTVKWVVAETLIIMLPALIGMLPALTTVMFFVSPVPVL